MTIDALLVRAQSGDRSHIINWIDNGIKDKRIFSTLKDGILNQEYTMEDPLQGLSYPMMESSLLEGVATAQSMMERFLACPGPELVCSWYIRPWQCTSNPEGVNGKQKAFCQGMNKTFWMVSLSIFLYLRVLQRSRTNRICMYRKKIRIGTHGHWGWWVQNMQHEGTGWRARRGSGAVLL